ncbi:MAG: hypothetical protein JW734_04530 [Candidatus Omnitrophica bacterium]|nr:hypothetical protein [Candidatus Omnitrophota bacterium]
MRNFWVILAIAGLVLSLSTGCSQNKAESSSQAIEIAKSMGTVKEKVDYLIGQAKTFQASKEFQSAIDVAQYILGYLDKDSTAAKNLLEKAKEALAQQAKGAMDEVTKKLEGLGK